MQREEQSPVIRQLLTRLTFQESRDWERFFIQALGRKDLETGPLYNLTDGGEGTSNLSAVTKQQRSAAQRATFALPEVKQRMSNSQRIAHTHVQARNNDVQLQ